MDSHDCNQPTIEFKTPSIPSLPTLLGFSPFSSFLLLLLCRCLRWTRSSGGLAMPAPGTPITVSPHNYGPFFFGGRWCWCLKLLLWRFCCCFVAGKLDEELGNWLRACGVPKSSDVRGVIAPWVFPFFFLFWDVFDLWFCGFLFLCRCSDAGMLGTPIPVGVRLLLLGILTLPPCQYASSSFFLLQHFFQCMNTLAFPLVKFFFSNCLLWWKFCIFRILALIFRNWSVFFYL